MSASLVGSEMCIRDRCNGARRQATTATRHHAPICFKRCGESKLDTVQSDAVRPRGNIIPPPDHERS
eukprot:6689158-Alexandrium_andersonii.AAC.1